MAPTAETAESSAENYEPPPRPEGLRGNLLFLHGVLVVVFCFFVFTALQLKHPVPEGMFELKNGTLIKIDDFDPVESGPYPKCHPHHGEYQQKAENGTRVWAKVNSAPTAGPFPPGHPENPEFKAKADAEMQKETYENRFTWKGLMPSLHLLALATLCVLIGSKHSVWLFTERDEQGKQIASQENLQSKDAYWFPVIGSAVLFGLFIVYKYIDASWIKIFITCYVVFMCIGGFGANLDQIVSLARGKNNPTLFKFPFFESDVTWVSLLGCLVAIGMGAAYVMWKNWIINNVFGISFCLLGIKLIGTSTYKTGAIMLSGLFLYDIFWVFGSTPVFGSNVMVTVAKGVEAPIKLIFPRGLDGCGNLTSSMLGLGDIVVPGVFIAFLAKFDAVVQGSQLASSYVYLNTTMVSYVLSLITTVGVMLFFNAAQPALLYIVPYVIVTSLLVALVRGELRELWRYEIPSPEDAAEESKKTN